MATILQIVRFEDRLLGTPDVPPELPEYFSAFQEILALACSRVDALRNTEPELERRAMSRRKIALRAQCSGGWGASRCLISDFGEGGLAMVCGHPHSIGDRVRVSWDYAAEAEPIQIDCAVRHVTGSHVGVEFVEITHAQRSLVLASLHEGPTRAAA